jgi:hypoxanthine phosphoribosyltransferase
MTRSATRVLLPAAQIQQRVRQMAREIEADYGEGPLYLVSVLKGSFIFVADLARAFNNLRVRIEFMGISSYGNAKTSSGQVKLTRDLDVSIEGQHVLIVEDIVDSGVTLNYLIRLLGARRPKSLAVATLLDKAEKRVQPVEIRYTGFQIPDEFVVGYGLDFAEDYRNLNDICVLEECVTKASGAPASVPESAP